MIFSLCSFHCKFFDAYVCISAIQMLLSVPWMIVCACWWILVPTLWWIMMVSILKLDVNRAHILTALVLNFGNLRERKNQVLCFVCSQATVGPPIRSYISYVWCTPTTMCQERATCSRVTPGFYPYGLLCVGWPPKTLTSKVWEVSASVYMAHYIVPPSSFHNTLSYSHNRLHPPYWRL